MRHIWRPPYIRNPLRVESNSWLRGHQRCPCSSFDIQRHMFSDNYIYNIDTIWYNSRSNEHIFENSWLDKNHHYIIFPFELYKGCRSWFYLKNSTLYNNSLQNAVWKNSKLYVWSSYDIGFTHFTIRSQNLCGSFNSPGTTVPTGDVRCLNRC